MVGYEGLHIWKTFRACENEPGDILPAVDENAPFFKTSCQPSVATFVFTNMKHKMV